MNDGKLRSLLALEVFATPFLDTGECISEILIREIETHGDFEGENAEICDTGWTVGAERTYEDLRGQILDGLIEMLEMQGMRFVSPGEIVVSRGVADLAIDGLCQCDLYDEAHKLRAALAGVDGGDD